jgi:hypothetical protein
MFQMRRSKHIPITAVLKAMIILLFGFGVAWIVLLSAPPPAAATRLGFAARIAWPVVHLLLTGVLVLAGGLMYRTLGGSVLPQSERSKKTRLICCCVTLLLVLLYAGSIVLLARNGGKPHPNTTQNAPQAQPQT